MTKAQKRKLERDLKRIAEKLQDTGVQAQLDANVRRAIAPSIRAHRRLLAKSREMSQRRMVYR